MSYFEYQVNNYPVKLTTAYIDPISRIHYTPKEYGVGEIPLRLVEIFESLSGTENKPELISDSSKDKHEPKLVVEAPPAPKPEPTENSLHIENTQAKIERVGRKTKATK